MNPWMLGTTKHPWQRSRTLDYLIQEILKYPDFFIKGNLHIPL